MPRRAQILGNKPKRQSRILTGQNNPRAPVPAQPFITSRSGSQLPAGINELPANVSEKFDRDLLASIQRQSDRVLRRTAIDTFRSEIVEAEGGKGFVKFVKRIATMSRSDLEGLLFKRLILVQRSRGI